MAVARLALALVVCALAIIVMIVLYRFDSLSSSASTSVSTEACALEYIEYSQKVKPLLDKWSEIFNLARYSSKFLLPTHIARLQDLKREVDDIDEPACLMVSHLMLVISIGDTGDFLMAVLADEPESVIAEKSNWLKFHMEQYWRLLDEAIGTTPTPESK